MSRFRSAVTLSVAVLALSSLSYLLGAHRASAELPAVAATVNGESITSEEWMKRTENLHFPDFLISTTPLRGKNQSAGQIALETLINGRLVTQYAKKVSLLPTEAEINTDFDALKKQPNIVQALEKKILTEAQMRDDIRLQRTLYNVVTVNNRATPAEVRRYYDLHPELYGQPERWRIGIIRVAGKPAADKVAAELKAGTTFETVATRMSEDPDSKKFGGELGTFNAADPALPQFVRDAVAKLKAGEVTAPLVSTLGTAEKPVYFFVRLTAKTERSMKTFEEVRTQVERAALMEKLGGGQQKLTELRKAAQITILLPGYQDLFQGR